MNDEKIQEILEREDISIAPLDKRFLAFMVDNFIVSVLILTILFSSNSDIFNHANDVEYMIQAMSSIVLPMIIIEIAYQTLFVAKYGATLGKMMFKIQVVSIDLLDSPSFGKSLLRASFRLFSQPLYYIPFIFALGDTFRRTLYDRICGTIVICQKK